MLFSAGGPKFEDTPVSFIVVVSNLIFSAKWLCRNISAIPHMLMHILTLPTKKLSKIVNVETVTNVVDGRHLENAKESEIEYELSEFLKHVPHIVKGDNHSAS